MSSEEAWKKLATEPTIFYHRIKSLFEYGVRVYYHEDRIRKIGQSAERYPNSDAVRHFAYRDFRQHFVEWTEAVNDFIDAFRKLRRYLCDVLGEPSPEIKETTCFVCGYDVGKDDWETVDYHELPKHKTCKDARYLISENEALIRMKNRYNAGNPFVTGLVSLMIGRNRRNERGMVKYVTGNDRETLGSENICGRCDKEEECRLYDVITASPDKNGSNIIRSWLCGECAKSIDKTAV